MLMKKLGLPHNAWVVVGDGRKALVLRNEGDEKFPNLKTVDVLNAGDNPATSQLGSDRPGRTSEHGGHHGAVEQTDWHEIAENDFARRIAAALETRHASGDIDALVVVAPPRTLAELRHNFSHALRAKIVAEVNKDLTKHPVHAIERLLTSGGGKQRQ